MPFHPQNRIQMKGQTRRNFLRTVGAAYKKNGDILLDINDKADVIIKQKNGNLSLSVME